MPVKASSEISKCGSWDRSSNSAPTPSSVIFPISIVGAGPAASASGAGPDDPLDASSAAPSPPKMLARFEAPSAPTTTCASASERPISPIRTWLAGAPAAAAFVVDALDPEPAPLDEGKF